jgi:alpha-tubulin suppressor-like RCC1 family protein
MNSPRCPRIVNTPAPDVIGDQARDNTGLGVRHAADGSTASSVKSRGAEQRLRRLIPLGLCVIASLLPSSVFASGSAHSLIVKSDGTVWAVGGNANGQIGDNTTTTRATFVQVPGLSNVVKVATGAQHSMAITSTGALYVWGDNAFGQVGDGSVTDRKTPVLLSLTGITAIAAGEYHSVALKSNGDAYAWGKNVNGQLGKGNTTQGNTPALILKKVSAIGAGFSHTLFLKTGGTVVAAGLNTDGQLGDGTTTQRNAPVLMTGVSTATAVSAGARHSVILLSGGSLVSTGHNAEGQLGNGTTTPRTTAGPVSSLSGISSISTGATHSVARKSDSTIWAWGRNHVGQLGDDTISNRSTAAQVAGLPAIATTYAGENNVFAVTSTGIVYSWGDNSSFQLGDGTTVNRWSPVQVSDATFAWRVATPTITVGSGTYALDQTVVVADATVGASIHYTQNGVDPTQSDPTVASGGSIVVSHSQTLKTKAFKAGMPASAVTTAVYVLQAPTPTFLPTGGTYTSAQNVAISSTSPGVTLRYTLDGTDPTAASPLYSSPIAIPTSTTMKAVGFKAGWANSNVGTAAYSMNFGTLAAPIVDPASGTYISSASVTMSASQSGATVRYTTDNTAPTVDSTPYAGPISIGTTTTVRAKAFHADYTASAETSRTYTITAATPTIDVGSGAYASGSIVTVSTTEAGATLRMTIDGTDPTVTSPSIPSGTSLLIGNFTLKARAFKAGVVDSAVAAATYVLTSPLGPGSIAAGGQHSLLATTDGRVYSWGSSSSGQLGDESTTSTLVPTLLNTITGVTQVSAGSSHTLARLWTGQVYAWGSNGSGRLGDGTTTQRLRPTLIPGLANIIAVAAGGAHSLALASDGRVYAWGANVNGQLGLGSTTSVSVATEITALANVIAIAAGNSHSFAVTSTGQLYAWGLNTNSRLGDGTTTQRLSPVLVNLSNVVSVAARQAHSVALTADGRVYTWGLGSSGQLGLGSTATMTTPTVVPSLQASSITAGSNFTAAVRHDGALMAWGANESGQIGDTTTLTRTSPTVVMGPSSVSSMALGDAHALAVTPEGAVWTWGDGTAGQLGDNAIVPRATPQSVFNGLADWHLAAPTITVPSGTFDAMFDVTVASSTSGADIHYTLTGSSPTQSDPQVPPNGLVSIATSSMLRARAFLAGRASSIDARANYQLQLAAPTIQPPTGFYLSDQTVSISSGDATSTLRYTLDGTDPTPTSTMYVGPFVVTTSQTIKARAYHTNGLEPSAISTATLSFEVAPPVASPPGGIFGAAPQVALSSVNGLSIRFTLDGSTPTASSTLYTSPIAIPAGGATLRSAAFYPDWPASSVRSDVYTIDTSAPTITPQLAPGLLNSWSRTPVTVTFHCFDDVQVVSCSPPVTVTEEGAAQIVSGTAVDSAGNETQLPIALNLDFAPPTVSITAPVNGLVTTNTTLAVTGQAVDALSGLAAVTCNGVAATMNNGALSCSVTLRPGRNVVVVAARDVAGNSASSGLTVTLTGTVTQLTMTPSERTMLVGETGTLSVRDNFGVAPTSPTWGTTNSAVVSLSADNPPILTALAPGTATIHASKNGFTAAAQVTVVAGETLPTGEVRLPSGTTRWKLPTVMSGQAMRTAPIYTNRREPGGPDLFTVEPNVGMTEYTVRALTADGAVLWKEAAPGVPLMGDSYGAVGAGIPSEYRCALYFGEDRFCYKAFVRFGGLGSALPWRYDSAGHIDRPAQAPDGTIYAIEHINGFRSIGTSPDEGNNKSVVILDGATGSVVGRVQLASEYSRTPCGFSENEPQTIGPIVGSNGHAYLLVHRRVHEATGTCNNPVTTFSEEGWALLDLTHEGQVGSIDVVQSPFAPEQLLPDGVGGLLIRVRRTFGSPAEARLVRFDEEFQRTEIVIALGARIDLVGEGGTVYLQSRTGNDDFYGITQAFNVVTGASLWTASPGWNLVAAKPNGGGTALGGGGELLSIDGTGQLDGTTAFGLARPVPVPGGVIGQGTSTAVIKAVAFDSPEATPWSATLTRVSFATYEPSFFGSHSMQNAPQQFACFAQLKYRPIAPAEEMTHAMWYVQNRKGVQYVITAGPAELNAVNYLNVFPITPPSQSGDNGLIHPVWWNSGLSFENCAGVDELLNGATSWSQNTIVYDWQGPNSNSAARHLGALGGFLPSAPPGSIGWQVTIPQ